MDLVYRGWFIKTIENKYYASKPSSGIYPDLFRLADTKEEIYKQIDNYYIDMSLKEVEE